MWDELRHFSGELAVPFAGDLKPDFQNSQPLNFFKTVFFTFLVFFCFWYFCFWWWFFLEKPSFDTARLQINIRGVSVIWIPRSRRIRTMARGTKGRRKDQFWQEDELHWHIPYKKCMHIHLHTHQSKYRWIHAIHAIQVNRFNTYNTCNTQQYWLYTSILTIPVHTCNTNNTCTYTTIQINPNTR